ncbi:hypothetical protein [Helicobacter cetorum]|uniref:hypothetical protein n=1 Tax=Helicobacter cetorum TaxID=138563 RepID=UPI000CF084BE|nr:hypothetical protein [Helicobacter cetorum]
MQNFILSRQSYKKILGLLVVSLCLFHITFAKNLTPKDFEFQKIESLKSMDKAFKEHANLYPTELKITSKYPSIRPIEIYSVRINEGKCNGYSTLEKTQEGFSKVYDQNPNITLERLVSGQKARTEDKGKIIATLKNKMLSKDEWIYAFFRIATPCAMKDIQKVVIWGLFENEPFKVEHYFK